MRKRYQEMRLLPILLNVMAGMMMGEMRWGYCSESDERMISIMRGLALQLGSSLQIDIADPQQVNCLKESLGEYQFSDEYLDQIERDIEFVRGYLWSHRGYVFPSYVHRWIAISWNSLEHWRYMLHHIRRTKWQRGREFEEWKREMTLLHAQHQEQSPNLRRHLTAPLPPILSRNNSKVCINRKFSTPQ